MKRLNVHMHVDDLARSIGFYSKLFSAEPTRIEADYAKWMLDRSRGQGGVFMLLSMEVVR